MSELSDLQKVAREADALLDVLYEFGTDGNPPYAADQVQRLEDALYVAGYLDCSRHGWRKREK
jgi:hypothetical protein